MENTEKFDEKQFSWLGKVSDSNIERKFLNPYKVANLANWETSATAILRFFLDPRENHGLGDIVVCALVDCINEQQHSNFLFSEVWSVTTENVTDLNKRSDIEVIFDTGSLVIENKLSAETGYNDLDGYRKTAHLNYEKIADTPQTNAKNYGGYLSRKRLSNAKVDKGDLKSLGDFYITYNDLFRKVREKIIERSQNLAFAEMYKNSEAKRIWENFESAVSMTERDDELKANMSRIVNVESQREFDKDVENFNIYVKSVARTMKQVLDEINQSVLELIYQSVNSDEITDFKPDFGSNYPSTQFALFEGVTRNAIMNDDSLKKSKYSSFFSSLGKDWGYYLFYSFGHMFELDSSKIYLKMFKLNDGQVTKLITIRDFEDRRAPKKDGSKDYALIDLSAECQDSIDYNSMAEEIYTAFVSVAPKWPNV
ncbi:PD-(D/E)XK nuclease family protein [Furfurilactobacillus milii]|uniref:PD-(D/E)XK nuclease family protein n=1 Tax=Furfurilactobacillus milii TaxID=2888272 RepID=UPI001F18287F|nr:PD-(D/E)XK nuclease family protein [Furfurilactobacillus milii]